MTPDALLSELETCTHADRVRRMVELGRRSRAGDAQATATLQAMAAHSGFYERLLTLLSCSGSGDGAHVVKSLSDESRLLRGLAAKLVPASCADERVEAALAGASRKTQVVPL
jgi:hypothetical protein